MPTEYHNRQIEGLRLSWRVDRIRPLALGLAVTEVPVASIQEFEEVYWFDEEFRPTCRSVVEHARRILAADLSDPIILSPDGFVIDGMHRVAKAVMTGAPAVRAVRLASYPEPDRIDG